MSVDPNILAEVLALVDELAGDWEFDGTVTPDTWFLRDLGLESLDLVVLGTALQERYGPLPFAEFLAELGERPVAERDVTIAGLVAYVERHRQVPAGGVR